MSANRIQQIKDIFAAALDLMPSERATFLARACANDSELRREVESLLSFETQAEDFIEKPALAVAAEILAQQKAATTAAGKQLSHYKIIAPLGAGGMGEVFLAEDISLGRKVALKLLPLQFTADDERVRRFEREAKAVSALNHPNIVTIHEIGTSEALHFIATEFIAGETLRQRISHDKLPLKDALDIAIQIAAALAAAHEAGIIHRDIKPENIMLRQDGYVKVLDFGLAKLMDVSEDQMTTVSTLTTEPGRVMGTVAYMSPEQLRALTVDTRADIWSLGVVLYEMITGARPFIGATTSAVIAAILEHEPTTVMNDLHDALPEELQQILQRALHKNRPQRYQTAQALLHDLQTLRNDLEFAARLESSGTKIRAGNKAPIIAPPNFWSPKTIIIAAIILLCTIGGGWVFKRITNQRWAHEQIPHIEQLTQNQKHFEAYDLALQTLPYLPNDPTIARLMPTISDNLTVTTQPAGAQVFLQRFAPNAKRELIGVTPMQNLRIARGEYLLTLEKTGYAPFERTISSKLYHYGTTMLPPDEPTKVEQKLIEANKLPDRMAFVPGSKYKLVSWRKPTENSIALADYFIDKYEVTNREYKEFIVAGGYNKPEFWQFPFRKDGHTLTHEAALILFKDRTNLPGPRNWTGQNFPEGKADHPVTDITWYEAAAYAAFRGKQLPTIFQWEKAARNGLFTYYSGYIMPWGPIDVTSSAETRANFKSSGTMPVGSFPFGISPFGCHDMAGNAAEWCLTETSAGFATAGAAWDDHPYLFPYIGETPGFTNTPKLGFRCVLNTQPLDMAAQKIDTANQIPNYQPISETEFRPLLSHYRYDQTPLEAKVIEAIETSDWRREKITYIGAGDERVIAYLYLPKSANQPFQVLNFVPAGDVYGVFFTLPEATEMALTPYIRAGRAVFTVVFKGFKERERSPNYVQPSSATIKRREEMVAEATDLRRGLDYLATRQDMDLSRLAYFGFSQGATEGIIFTAVEERYKGVIFMAGGMHRPLPNTLPEITQPNFAPFIRAPKLMLSGRYDEVFALTTTLEPFYKLLREQKKLVLYDGSHTPPVEIAVPVINQWLDEKFGAVKHN